MSEEQTQAVILDPGFVYLKSGLSGNDTPSLIIENPDIINMLE